MAVRAVSFDVGETLVAVGNTPADAEELLREHVDVIGSSGRWGIEKPAAAFFERIAIEADLPMEDIAYVGDRVDHDVDPPRAAGMVAVHLRRGPWGYLQRGTERAHLRIDSLCELPGALRRV